MKKSREPERTYATVEPAKQGGPGSAGQAGDTQGLPAEAEAGDASVKELLEEGQTFEAEALLGIEEAEGEEGEEVKEVRVRQSRRPQGPDDVPPEVPGQP